MKADQLLPVRREREEGKGTGLYPFNFLFTHILHTLYDLYTVSQVYMVTLEPSYGGY